MSLYRRARAAARRQLFPTRAEAAWRQLDRLAAEAPRYTPGRITLMDLDIEYVDALTLAPQFNDIFVRETLEMSMLARAPRVLDCGANVGLASLAIKRQYPAARVTAFEADGAICEVLRRNLARNGAGDVEVVCRAVWSADGEVSFRREGSDSGAIEPAGESGIDVVSVPATRLRHWLQEPVDLLKLDIEGAELEVLQDCESALRTVATIAMEVHEFDPARRLLPACLELLTRAGFAYALSDLHGADRRVAATPAFVNVNPAWVVTVKAWRENR